MPAQPASLALSASCTESTPFATNGSLERLTYSFKSSKLTAPIGKPSTTSYFPSVPGTWSISTPTAVLPHSMANLISDMIFSLSANGLIMRTVSGLQSVIER